MRVSIWAELTILVLLAIANGVFAAAEIAILSIRKTRLRELAERKNRRANAVIALRDQPERFLATVQIGITVVGASAAAFGGATLASHLTPLLEGVGPHADDLALALVVVFVSYLSLVLGELIPKSLALRAAEGYALLVGRPLLALSFVARPLVWFLTASSNLVLRLFHDRTTFIEARLSPDEIQQLVEEAASAGTVDPRAGEIASRALDFGNLRIGALMVPRGQMVAIDCAGDATSVRELVARRGHMRIPVYEGSPDNVIGYVTARDLLRFAEEPSVSLAELMRPAQFVPESSLALDVLKRMQRTHAHLVLVVDEHGHITGLATLEDLVEELIGEIFEEHETPVETVRREADGTALVLGSAPLHEVNRALDLSLPEGPEWSTMGGLAMSIAGAIPAPGARLPTAEGAVLEVVESSGRKVHLVRVHPPPPTPADEEPAETARSTVSRLSSSS
jgi:putative hemolysin